MFLFMSFYTVKMNGQCNNNVGTINGISNFFGESTRHDLNDTVFLCWKDLFYLDHNDDFNISSDPDNSTPGGIGYGWYKSKPTVSGDTRLDILLGDDEFRFNGDPDMMISVDDLNGDGFFENYYFAGTTTFNDAVYSNGNPALMYYAPITVDLRKGNRGYFENGGPCVKAGVDQAFPVVYLNPIKISDIQYNVGGDPLRISFVVNGGVAEFYRSHYSKSVNYSGIDIVDSKYSGNERGVVLTQNFSHGDIVTVQLPKYGEYDVIISDDISCSSNEQLNVSGGLSPTLTIDSISGQQGDIECVTFSVQNYDNIAFIAEVFNYDPNVLEFVSLEDAGGVPDSYFVTPLEPGRIWIYWYPNPTTHTFIQKMDLFKLCFRLKGDIGDCSPVIISASSVVNNDSEDLYPYTEQGQICIDPPDGLFVSANYCGANSGEPNASLTFKVFNGNPPYNYVITRNGPPSTIVETGIVDEERIETSVFGLIPGSYSIDVTDSDLKTFNLTLFISNSPPLTIESLDITHPVCYGQKDGEIIIKIEDGDFYPHSIKWSNSIFDKDTLSDIGNGTYGVTITDLSTGCETDTFVTLNTTKLELDLQLLDDASCKGINDARAIANISGGNPHSSNQYTFKWQSGSNSFTENSLTSSTFNNGGEGTLYLSVNDSAVWCKVEDTLEITTKYTMEINNNPEDPNCFGVNDGQVLFDANLIGYTNDTFELEFPVFPFPNFQKFGSDAFLVKDLGEGKLIVRIYETHTGCFEYDTITLTDPPAIGFSLEKGTVCCPSTELAYADFHFNNGNLPITLSGIGADVTITDLSTVTFYDLGLGTHTCVITDNNGCDSTVVFEIEKGVGCLNFDTIKFDLLGCDVNATTDIEVIASSSFGNIIYRWTDLLGINLGNTNILNDKGAGTYIIEIVDEKCTIRDTIVIAQAQPFSFTNDITSAECGPGESGGFLGSACIRITGDNTGYTYDWGNGISGECVNDLGAGDYVVTISDGKGCSALDTVTVGGASPMEIDYLDIQGISCNDGLHTDGSAIIDVNGGDNIVGVYNFTFNGGMNLVGKLVTIENLSSGNNYLTVSYNTTSGNTCTKLDSFEVGVPEKLVLDKTNMTIVKPTCFNDCDGKAIVNAKGGNNSAYFYHWQETGEDGAVGVDLCAGTYHIQITDANLCTIIDSVEIIQPDELVVVIDSFNTKDVNCSGNNSGQIQVDYSGGNTDGIYTFDWSPDVSDTKIATDLALGVYTVTVTDHKGCSDFVSYEVKGQSPLIFNALQADTIKCFGDKTCIYLDTIYGGAGPDYSFSINGGAVISADSCREVYASEEPYLISVFDSEGCREEKELLITQPEEIIVDLGDEIVIDLGDSKTVHVNTNANIKNVTWDIDSTKINYQYLNFQRSEIEIAANFNDVIYATVEDVDGCTATGELNVLVNTFRNVYIPNIFTPDGDGLNDIFRLTIGKGIDRINYMKIYNRWGEMMHLEENLLPTTGNIGEWDGTYKGRRMNPGVYVYLVEVKFLDGRTILYRGSITLLR